MASSQQKPITHFQMTNMKKNVMHKKNIEDIVWVPQ